MMSKKRKCSEIKSQHKKVWVRKKCSSCERESLTRNIVVLEPKVIVATNVVLPKIQYITSSITTDYSLLPKNVEPCFCSAQSYTNIRCKEEKNCPLLDLYKGVKYNLEIFQTENRGLGLRTLEDIPAHSFVCEYAGEIISAQECRERQSQMPKDYKDYTYELTLNWVVDPYYYSNCARFANHGCDDTANLEARCIMIGQTTEQTNDPSRLAFFSTRKILAGSELLVDYCWYLPGQHGFQVGTIKCLCGGKDCRKWLR